MGLRHRAGICALALLAGSTALSLEPVVLRNLVIGHEGQRIAIGAVRVPLWSAAFAQPAESFSLDNVSFTFGSTTYEAKRIEFAGVASSRADIEALFSSNAAEPMESRLGRVSAKQVTIPEVRVKQTVGTDSQTTTYRNAVLSDVSQGRIASIVVEATAMESAGARDKVVITSGRTTMNDVDLPAMARLFETKADSASAPLARIYGAFSVENIEQADDAAGVTFRIARLGGRDFMGRPTQESWNGTMGLMTEMADKDELSSQDQARLLPAIVDLIDSFRIGLLEASGIEVTSKGSDAPNLLRINRIAYSGETSSQPPDMRMEGLEFSDKDNRVKIGTSSLTGFSYRQTLEGLKNLQGKSLDEIDLATARTLIPTLGTLRISDLDIDALNEESDKGERFKLTSKDFAITADEPVNGIPTNLRIEQRNAVIPLAANSTDDLVKELSALGYGSLDASYTVAATWNEASSEILVTEAFLQGVDLGSVSLTGTIGNVSKDLFSADEATASAALVGAKAKTTRVTIEDNGLLARYLANAAKEQKTTPENLRQMYAGAAPFVLSSILGNSEQSKVLGQAVSQFIAKSGKLTVEAEPKNPSGFGVMDAMLASDPKAALQKLNITAKVE